MTHFELILTLNWHEGGLTPSFLDFPSFSWMTDDQIRQVYAPLPFRLDSRGGLHVLSQHHLVLHFHANTIQTTLLPISHFADFQCDPHNNTYTLQTAPQRTTLSKFTPSGSLVWQQTNFSGKVYKLLLDANANPIVVAAFQVFQVHPETGNLVILANFAEDCAGKVFLSADDKLIQTRYFQQLNRHGIVLLDPGHEKVTIGDERLYGLLPFAFGADHTPNVYAYQLPNLFPLPAIVKIAFNGTIIHQENFKDLVVRPSDNAIFTHYPHDHLLTIVNQTHQTTLSIPVPEAHRAPSLNDYKLISVGDAFYIHTGEAPATRGKLLIFDQYGQLAEVVESPDNLLHIETSVQSFQEWQVDAQGHIYLPLTAPDGFKIVRLSLNYL